MGEKTERGRKVLKEKCACCGAEIPEGRQVCWKCEQNGTHKTIERKTYCFTIDEKLPSLNEVINKNRLNRYAGAKMKKDLERLIGAYILKAKREGTLEPLGEHGCIITMQFFEKTRRRDVDNIQSSQKFNLDALQKYGILKNDSRKYVKQIYHEIVDSDRDGVAVGIIVKEG